MRRLKAQGAARGLRTKVALLVAFVLVAVGVAACGGGSGSSSSGRTAESASGTTEATGGSKAAKKRSKGSSSKGKNGFAKSGSGGGSPAHSDSGGGAAQFKTHGGDNSIQSYGGEAGGSELSQAAAALHAYLDARAGEEWAKACANMAAGVSKSLQQFAGAQSAPSGKNGKPKHLGCPQLLAGMSAGMPAYLKRDLTKADVGALRVQGDRAFLLYHGAHHTDYFMPMAKEGGGWKVAAIAASALP